MKIYRFGSLGYYRGEAEAKKDEGGKDIIPDDTTTIKPPAVTLGKRLKFVDGAWIQEPVPQPSPEDIQKAVNEEKVRDEVRLLAIKSLIAKGELPVDYK